MNLSFKQYRAIDLAILAVILAAAEALTTYAAVKWFPTELYTLSPTIAVVCIVMMRWGAYAAIHAFVGGAAFCIASGATPTQFAVYCIGNCFMLLALVMIKMFGKNKVKAKHYLTIVFVIAAYFGAQIGRWLVGLIFGAPIDSIVGFLTTDALSLLFAVVVVLISRRVDGLFEDQKSYLIRTESERKRQRMQDGADDRDIPE